MSAVPEQTQRQTPAWQVIGDWFDVCNCRIPCPCTFGEAPSDGLCEGIQAWHVRDGQYGEVDLSDLNVVVLDRFEGNIWAGEARVAMGIYVDERGDEEQCDALARIFGGQAGGWPGGLLSSIGEVRGVRSARIEMYLAEDLGSWSVEIEGTVTAAADALSGPTTPPGARVQVINPPGAEVGPGQIATWGRATAGRADGFGFSWEWIGRSSKHFPFDWTGP